MPIMPILPIVSIRLECLCANNINNAYNPNIAHVAYNAG